MKELKGADRCCEGGGVAGFTLYLAKVEDLGGGVVVFLQKAMVCGPVTGTWRPQVGRHHSGKHRHVLGVGIKDKHEA